MGYGAANKKGKMPSIAQLSIPNFQSRRKSIAELGKEHRLPNSQSCTLTTNFNFSWDSKMNSLSSGKNRVPKLPNLQEC